MFSMDAKPQSDDDVMSLSQQTMVGHCHIAMWCSCGSHFVRSVLVVGPWIRDSLLSLARKNKEERRVGPGVCSF